MKTLLAQPNPQFNIRECPIWTIPQLAYFRKRGWKVVSFRPAFSGALVGAYGFVVLEIPMQGYFEAVIWKSNMNSPGPVPVEWFG